MQLCTFCLDEESGIVTPLGTFSYSRVLMRLKTAPGFAQTKMEEVLGNIEDVEICIDDIGVFTDCREKHLVVLTQVLPRLEENRFTVNPRKYEWGAKEHDWLGYWIIPEGLKPWSKKVDAVLKNETIYQCY